MSSLRRRDLVLLPLVFFLTWLICILAGEGFARAVWPEEKVDSCLKEGEKGLPKSNCTAWTKAAEGPWVENRYNDCGFRANGSCAPSSASVIRIATIGSSTSFGYLVPFSSAWPMVAARMISDHCGIPVNVQSDVRISQWHSGFSDLNEVALDLPRVIALRPSAVVMVITPFDLFDMPSFGFDLEKARKLSASRSPPPEGLMGYAKHVLSESRAFAVAQHYMYNDVPFYVSMYLHYGERADFMRSPLSAAWDERVHAFDNAVAYIADRLREVDVPLLIAYSPQQAQAYIIARDLQLPGIDTALLGRQLRASVERHGALFIDGARAFAGQPDPQNAFYHADGHLTAFGNGLLGQVVGEAIVQRMPMLCPHPS